MDSLQTFEACIVWWVSCRRCPLVFPSSIRWPGSYSWRGFIYLRRRRCQVKSSATVDLWTLWSASSGICCVCSRYLCQDLNWEIYFVVNRWSIERNPQKIPIWSFLEVYPISHKSWFQSLPSLLRSSQGCWLCSPFPTILPDSVRPVGTKIEFGNSDKIYIHHKMHIWSCP